MDDMTQQLYPQSRNDIGSRWESRALPPMLTCIHEAGHAVAHLAINDRLHDHETIVRRVWVAADGSGSCETRTRPEADPHRQAVRALAGPVAERRWQFGPTWKAPASLFAVDADVGGAARIDFAMAMDATWDADMQPPAAMAWAWHRAARLVGDEWRGLLRMGRILQCRRSLSGDEFEAMWRRTRG